MSKFSPAMRDLKYNTCIVFLLIHCHFWHSQQLETILAQKFVGVVCVFVSSK